jgi:hypothetical protein
MFVISAASQSMPRAGIALLHALPAFTREVEKWCLGIQKQFEIAFA